MASSTPDRLELLLFRLGRQLFAINVLKITEVLPCPALTRMPHGHPAVRGVAQLRREQIPAIDLAMAIGHRGQAEGELTLIVAGFNRSRQGFLVHGVDRIVVCDWRDVRPPSRGMGRSYTSGVTRIGEQLIQILDLERVLAEVTDPDDALVELPPPLEPQLQRRVLVVDDSAMARAQTARTLDHLQVPYLMCRDGREALDLLVRTRAEDIAMVISDIEMPELDGYSLARAIRADAQLSALYILLHTSLNGAINLERAQAAGADDVLTKFVPGELARALVKGLRASVDARVDGGEIPAVAAN